MIYDTTVFATAPESWIVLWDPKYKGKISVWDDLSTVYMAAQVLGYDKPNPDQLYNLSDEQLEAVMRVLLRTLTKVNVNTATAAQLPLVLDISEATAQALVKYRGAHGNFKTLDDLKKVPGIDAAKLEARKDRVAF